MAGSPTKRGNWGNWAVIDNPPPKAGNQCGGCIHYNEDGSCNVLPVIIHEVGRDYWKKCKEYTKTRPIAERVNNTKKREPDVGEQPVYVNCKYLSDENSICTLWNSGWRKCTPEKCAYLDFDLRKKRSCTECIHAVSYTSILRCKKAQRAIHDINACYCCFFANANRADTTVSPDLKKKKHSSRVKK